jgi:penicillin-binding protein 1A
MAASARRRHAPRNRSRNVRATKKRPWWKRWWLLLLVFPAIAAGAVGLLLFYLVFSTVPLPEDIAPTSSVIFDRDGDEVGGLAAETAREDIPLDELPEHVEQAVLAAEDRGFYEHRGISVTGIARALFTNIRAGGVAQGGSTITQQYIKNAALTPEQTYRRKVEEAALAIKLEREYDKEEILTFYLNTIYWGRGAYGIEAAAQTTFDIPASELDVNQAATLAGVIAAPEHFNPLDNPDGADQRRRYVLAGMLEEGYITQQEHDDLVAAGLPEVTERRTVAQGPNAYYIDAVRRELAARPEFADGALFQGLRIHTQLDQSMQVAAQETLAQAVREGPTDTGSIVTIDPHTGGVRALVGGPDIDQQSFNTAIRSVRQSGSTFKAFTLQAFLEDDNHPDTRFPAPAEIEIDDAEDPIRNFGGSSFGEQTVRQATASSTNTVFVQMQEMLGREEVIDAARRAGLPRDKAEEPFPTERAGGDAMRPLAGLTLGQDEMSPLEMASAFGTYPAEGLHASPHLVVRVEDADGNLIHETNVEGEDAVEVNVARAVTDVLRGVVTDGSGQAADIGRPSAGKTGTTNEGRDVWYVGYVPQLVTSVWLGNLDNTPIDHDNATGGGLAAPVWATYMSRAVEGLDEEDFEPPSYSDFDRSDEESEGCPEGYEFADPPTEADARGFFPDVLVDITDEDGRPCVEIPPPPDECPDGYEFADPPEGPDEHGRTPDVRDDLRDLEGRPCVEILEDIEEEPEEEPAEEEEPVEEEPPPPEEEEPAEPPQEEPPADDGDEEGDGNGDGDGGGGGDGGDGGGGDAGGDGTDSDGDSEDDA